MNLIKHLSLWAYQNPRFSQSIIFVSQVLLAILCWQLAVKLFAADIRLSPVLFYVGGLIFLTAVFLYPIRRSRFKIWKLNYTRQKILDFFLIASYVVCALTVNNNVCYQVCQEREISSVGTAKFIVNKHQETKPTEEKEKWSKRNLRKKYRKYLRKQRRQNSETDSILIALLQTVITLLFIIILAFSCNLACSGGGGGGLVLILGGLLVVGLLVLLVKLKKRYAAKEKRYKPKEETKDTEKKEKENN